MNREEVKKILHVICATYPNFHPDNMADTIDIWTVMLEEYEYKDISVALKKYVLTSKTGFAPSISQLVSCTTSNTEPTEQEVWHMVYKAICNSNYNSEEEYSKLPEPVRRAVGSPANLRECASMDINDIQTIYQSQFLRSYRAVKEQFKTEALLPPSMRITAGKLEAIGVNEE